MNHYKHEHRNNKVETNTKAQHHFCFNGAQNLFDYIQCILMYIRYQVSSSITNYLQRTPPRYHNVLWLRHPHISLHAGRSGYFSFKALTIFKYFRLFIFTACSWRTRLLAAAWQRKAPSRTTRRYSNKQSSNIWRENKLAIKVPSML